jgi:hypothetical protein
MKQRNGHAARVWTCNVDKYRQHVQWTCTMDMDMYHGHGHAPWTWMCNKDVEINMQHGHGHAPWQRTYSMNYMQHGREHFA